jgi:hypothetical protein
MEVDACDFAPIAYPGYMEGPDGVGRQLRDVHQ